MNTSENIADLAAALAKAQGEFKAIPKNKTGKVSGVSKSGKSYEYEYKYAALPDVLDGLREALCRHGLSIVQATFVDHDALFIKTRVIHTSGQYIESIYPVCSITGDHQKMGAAMTYSRRYALTSLVGVAADEDTDGVGAETVSQRSRPVAAVGVPPKAANAIKKERPDEWAQIERAVRAAQTTEDLRDLWDAWEPRTRDYPPAWKDQLDDLWLTQADAIEARKVA